MAKASTGSLPRGRRTRAETPPVPDPARLTSCQRAAQEILAEQVRRVGGRFAVGRPTCGSPIEPIVALFDAHARARAATVGGSLVLDSGGRWMTSTRCKTPTARQRLGHSHSRAALICRLPPSQGLSHRIQGAGRHDRDGRKGGGA